MIPVFRPAAGRRVFRVIVICALVAPLSLLAAAPKWLKLETPEIVIYSDASQKDIVEYAVRYTAFRRAFHEFFLEPGRPLPISTFVLFRKEGDFKRHAPHSKDSNTNLVTYSVEVDGSPLTSLHVSDGRDTALALTYEFDTVWALKRLGYYVPLWLSQGAGQVLSTLELQKGRCIVGLPRAGGHSDDIRWPRFFEISESSPEYRGPTATGAYHAQAWGLAHLILLNDMNTRTRFADLAYRLRKTPALEAVEWVVGAEASKLNAAIREHLYSPHALREVAFDEPAVRASFLIQPAPPAEVLAQKANLLETTGRTAEANALLDEANALSSEAPAVKEAWARRFAREGRPHDAVRLYRESIAAGSKNVWAYLYSATQRLNDNMTRGSDIAGEGGPESLVAIGELRQAIKLNPGSIDSYRMLGRAFFVAPKPLEEYVTELTPAITPGENARWVRYYRGLIYSRLNRPAECIADLRLVVADAPETFQNRRAIQQRCFQEEAKLIQSLVAKSDYASARRIIAEAEEQPEPITDNYARVRAFVAEHEAWAQLSELASGPKDAALRQTAAAFAANFPQSKRRARALELASEGAAEAASGAAPAAP